MHPDVTPNLTLDQHKVTKANTRNGSVEPVVWGEGVGVRGGGGGAGGVRVGGGGGGPGRGGGTVRRGQERVRGG